MAGANEKSVLFVCLGNICRSPMAEAILNDLLGKRGDRKEWLVDSCGTGNFHVGEQPDERALKTLSRHGIMGFQHTVRQLQIGDLETFSYIFAMDYWNMQDIEDMGTKSSKAKVILLRKFDPEAKSEDEQNLAVIDPYYEDESYFETCFIQCLRSLQAFLEQKFPL